MTHILRDFVPPLLWRSASRVRKAIRGRGRRGKAENGVEQPPEFYDRAFETAGHWKDHYTDSHYYPLWTVIADRIRSGGLKRILDIGCGPGQVACLMHDIGVPEYKGLDFSPTRVARARAVCPVYDFVVANVFEDDLLETHHYDCILMMEFLEHIEKDVEVLKRIRPGAALLATVPNFPASGHVRYFESTDEVRTRYGSLFRHVEVTAIQANKHGATYYLLQGTR